MSTQFAWSFQMSTHLWSSSFQDIRFLLLVEEDILVQFICDDQIEIQNNWKVVDLWNPMALLGKILQNAVFITRDWGALVLELHILLQKLVSLGPFMPLWQDCQNTLMIEFNDPNSGWDRDINRKILLKGLKMINERQPKTPTASIAKKTTLSPFVCGRVRITVMVTVPEGIEPLAFCCIQSPSLMNSRWLVV